MKNPTPIQNVSDETLSILKSNYTTDAHFKAVIEHLSKIFDSKKISTLKDPETEVGPVGLSLSKQFPDLENSYYKAMDLFKHLSSLQIGEFVIGRRGKSSRIIWFVDPSALARVLQGKDKTLEYLSKGTRAARRMITHVYQLPDGQKLHFPLPIDLSPEEANGIVRFIKGQIGGA